MKGIGLRGKLVVIAVALLGVVAARPAGAVGRVDRKGVYALGGWYQYSFVEGQSRFGYDFTSGSGYSLHFRYNLTRKSALAVYFDNQHYAGRADSLGNQLRLTTAHAGLRFFSLRGDAMRYAEITAGFYRPEIRFPKTQTQSSGDEFSFPPEGLLVHAGVGAEIFFTQSWAVEIGLHGYGMTGKGLTREDTPRGEKDFTVTGQVAVGLDYYLLR